MTHSEQAAHWAYVNDKTYEEAADVYVVNKGQIARAWKKLGYPARPKGRRPKAPDQWSQS